MNVALCPNRYCGLALRHEVRFGVTVDVCDGCERNRRGICRDCPRPLVFKGTSRGSTQRCKICQRVRRKKISAMSYERNRDEKLSAMRARYRYNEPWRRDRLAYQAEYRKTHRTKRDAAANLYQRTWYAEAMKDPVYAANEYARRQRKRNAHRLRRLLDGTIERYQERDREWIALAKIVAEGVLQMDPSARRRGRAWLKAARPVAERVLAINPPESRRKAA